MVRSEAKLSRVAMNELGRMSAAAVSWSVIVAVRFKLCIHRMVIMYITQRIRTKQDGQGATSVHCLLQATAVIWKTLC